MAQRMTYTEEHIAHAVSVVRSLGGNVLEASRRLGIPHRTVASWIRGERRKPASQSAQAERDQLVRKERLLQAEKWNKVANLSLDHLLLAIPEMKGKDLAVAAGIATDHYVALTGGTRNTQDVNVTVTLADLYRRQMPTVVDTTMRIPDRVETDTELIPD